MKVSKRSFLIIIVVLFSLPHDLYAVSINSIVGLTPAKEQLLIRTQIKFTKKSDDPTDKDRDREDLNIPVTVVYGVSEKMALFVTVPYVIKELKSTESGSRRERGDSGLGDITLLGKYRIYTRDYPGKTSRLSILCGIKVPTGEDDEEDSFGRLPQGLQLGSGSFDPFAGVAYTWQTIDHEIDGDLSYKFNTEGANDFKFGDLLKYNIAYQKRVWPFELPEEGLYSQLNLVLELNGQYQERNKLSGVKVPDSGGHIIFLSPGIQYVTERFIAESSVQLPVIQDLNGSQVETDYIITAGIRITF